MSNLNPQNPHHSGQVFPMGTPRVSTGGTILPDHINMLSSKLAETQLKAGNGFALSKDSQGITISQVDDTVSFQPFKTEWLQGGITVWLGNIYGGGDAERMASLIDQAFPTTDTTTKVMVGSEYYIDGAKGNDGKDIEKNTDANSLYVVFEQDSKVIEKDMLVYMDFSDDQEIVLRYGIAEDAKADSGAIIPIAYVTTKGVIVQIVTGDIYQPYFPNSAGQGWNSHPFKVSRVPGTTRVRIAQGFVYPYGGSRVVSNLGSGMYDNAVEIGGNLDNIIVETSVPIYDGYLLNDNGYQYNIGSTPGDYYIYLVFERMLGGGDGEVGSYFQPQSQDEDVTNITDVHGNIYPAEPVRWKAYINIGSPTTSTTGSYRMNGWNPDYIFVDTVKPASQNKFNAAFWDAGKVSYKIARINVAEKKSKDGKTVIGYRYNIIQMLRSDCFFFPPMDAGFVFQQGHHSIDFTP